MTEADVIKAMRDHLEAQLPKTCSSCNHRFGTLREYAIIIEHVGPAMPMTRKWVSGTD